MQRRLQFVGKIFISRVLNNCYNVILKIFIRRFGRRKSSRPRVPNPASELEHRYLRDLEKDFGSFALPLPKKFDEFDERGEHFRDLGTDFDARRGKQRGRVEQKRNSSDWGFDKIVSENLSDIGIGSAEGSQDIGNFGASSRVEWTSRSAFGRSQNLDLYRVEKWRVRQCYCESSDYYKLKFFNVSKRDFSEEKINSANFEDFILFG